MKGLLRSFGYAFRGIFTCIKNERNMRIHLVVTLYMFYYLLVHDWFTVTRTQFAILFVMCAAVMAGELVNTAVERAVDLASEEHTQYGRIAKDCAAGAVLISAIFAVLCGIAIMWQPDAFRQMFLFYKEHISSLATLLITLVLSSLFVFRFPKKD